MALPDDYLLGLDFLYRRRHRHPHGLKDFAAHTLALRADRKTVIVFHYFDTLQRFEILFDVAPFKITVEPGPLVDTPVNADLEKMRIVLRNLLDNALKHTPDDGPAVSISTAHMQDRLEIVVEDRGEGIPASALPHLFEPFYRPDISRSRKTGGYGLGLSLCKAIVDAHGGSIDLVSTPG